MGLSAAMDALIVGAGVIGLAAGAALARRGAFVIVAEAENRIGAGVSSRNSEVIHGGMYYAPGSARAALCVDGRRRLYEYCATRKVPHAKPGKLIVATSPAEISRLEAIAATGRANGVEGLVIIDGAEAMKREPALSCLAALVSPETGIIDSHALMLSLSGEIEDHGGRVALATRVSGLSRTNEGWTAHFGSDAFGFDAVVNAAGLGAQAIAALTRGYPAALIPRQVLAKGNYFSYRGRAPFRHLIYPVPVDGGLGVHVTLDLSGRMKFGPDVEWVEREDYGVDAARAAHFYPAIRRYFPALPDDSLVADYAGIRPKLTGPGEPAADFLIASESDHGLAGLVALFGIESPGLTSALSIAERIASRLIGD